jgi:hypothetical protein
MGIVMLECISHAVVEISLNVSVSIQATWLYGRSPLMNP